MSNAPMRFLTWRWEDEDEAVKVIYTPDTKRPNCGTFVLQKEDHTMGNLIRLQMLQNPSVRFAGYKMPHPLVFDVQIKVETMDRSTKPVKVFQTALDELKTETETMETQFREACDEYEYQR